MNPEEKSETAPAAGAMARGPIPLGKGTIGTFTSPENELERVLVAFRQREASIPDLLDALFNSTIFVVTVEPGLAWADNKPQLVPNASLFSMIYPEFNALGIFTSLSRTLPVSREHAEFRFAVAVPAGEFLSGLTGRFGLIINPYWDMNLQWNPEQVERIRAMMRRE